MLLSRVANACYWLARYQERAEFTARMVDVNLITVLDDSRAHEAIETEWRPIVFINDSSSRFGSSNGYSYSLPEILTCLCLDPANPNSIASCIRTARENARQAREQISSEMWEQINEMYHSVNQ